MSAEHIRRIGDDLEREERYTHRQDDLIDPEHARLGTAVAYIGKYIEHLERGSEEIVDHIGEEIRIFEIRQYTQIDYRREDEPNLGAILTLAIAIDLLRNEPVAKGNKKQYEQK